MGTPFDRQLFWRSSAYLALLVVLGLGVVVATDEAGSGWSQRAARMGALGPLLAAVAVWSSLQLARSRGELRALSGLGWAPWRVAAGALVAGWLGGMLTCALLILPGVDAGALFPALTDAPDWTLRGAALSAPGVSIFPDGNVRVHEGAEVAGLAGRGPRAVDALWGIVPLAALLPVWSATPTPALQRAAIGVGCGLLLIAGLHGVAAGRLQALTLLLPSLPVLIHVLARRKAAPAW